MPTAETLILLSNDSVGFLIQNRLPSLKQEHKQCIRHGLSYEMNCSPTDSNSHLMENLSNATSAATTITAAAGPAQG